MSGTLSSPFQIENVKKNIDFCKLKFFDYENTIVSTEQKFDPVLNVHID